jgi:hypothetical protein
MSEKERKPQKTIKIIKCSGCEVMGVDKDYEMFLAKSRMAANSDLSLNGAVSVSVKNKNKCLIEKRTGP